MSENWQNKQYKIMNWYYKNTTKIFRYVLGVLVLFLFIFLVYIIIPTDTKNGVTNNYLLENGKEKAVQDKAVNNFTITAISDKYTKEQSIQYTANILKFIDQHPNQDLYKKVFLFLLEECKKPKNENTTILFNSLKKKVSSDDFLTKLNGDNAVLKTNLDICKEEIKDIEKVSDFDRLKKRHQYLINQINLIKEKRAFDKKAYGDIYNEETGMFNFQEQNDEILKEIKGENDRLEELKDELLRVEGKIKDIKPNVEFTQDGLVNDSQNSVEQNKTQQTNQTSQSQISQTTN